jgi:phenylalanyl-tRNA synthetase beta chain
MKISYEWLREYVRTKLRANTIAASLTQAGHEVSSIDHQQGDDIFDLEITANRPDCLSHIGIAREVAAALQKTLILPKVRSFGRSIPKHGVRLNRENNSLCPFYTGRVIKDVRVGPSPKWLARRLLAVGLRPVNNIVDITNFVLLETGHPLHAFDLDKIEGLNLYIRNARAEERIVTLDNVERKLEPSMLVIADQSQPVAIAGIIGGRSTEITHNTRNILLESAYFDPVCIRRTAFKLGLSTDSSYRFERGADLGNVVFSSERAADLICDIAKGRSGAWMELGTDKQAPVIISLRLTYLNKLLGVSLQPVEVKNILKRLGYKVKGSSIMEVEAPGFRNDTTREADLIEEIARMYGYDKIPATPASVIVTDQDADKRDFMKKRSIVYRTLMSMGFNEILTYSLISRDALKDMPWPEDSIVRIKNPLSREQEFMRPSLIPGMLKALEHNLSRQVYDISFFEVSNVYFKTQDTYNQEPRIALSYYERTDIQKPGHGQSGLFRIKGAITQLAQAIGVKGWRFEKATSALFEDNTSIAILSGNTILGSMGSVKRTVVDASHITGTVFAAELKLHELARHASLQRYYQPLPRFPYAYRDISFAVDRSIEYKAITDQIMRSGGAIVENIELLSEYTGKQIQPGCRGLAVRIIFRAKDKTLTEDEINTSDLAIRTALSETFDAILR